MFFKIINRRYIRTRVIQFVYSNSVLEDDLDRSILNFRNSISSSLDLLYCSIDLINETKNHFLSIQTTKQSFKVILDNPYFKFLSDLKIPKKLICILVLRFSSSSLIKERASFRFLP